MAVMAVMGFFGVVPTPGLAEGTPTQKIGMVAVDRDGPDRLLWFDVTTGTRTDGPVLGDDVRDHALSPDGTRIAYWSRDTWPHRLVVLDLTSGQHQEFDWEGSAWNVAFSPDGSRLFVTGAVNGTDPDSLHGQLRTVSLADRSERVVASVENASFGDLAVSPDGTRVAVTTWRQSETSDTHDVDLHVIDLVTGKVGANLTADEARWVYSPMWLSETEIAYNSDEHEATVVVDTTRQEFTKRIFRAATRQSDGWTPVRTHVEGWSPDGRYLMALEYTTSPPYRLDGAYIVTRDGAAHPVDHGELPTSIGLFWGLLWAPPSGGSLEPHTRTSDTGGVHTDRVARALDEGWMHPCGLHRFCPSEPTTRRQMAVALTAVLGLADPGPQRWAFQDVSEHDPTGGAIRAVASAGISLGCGDGTTYCPDSPVSRAQMATFLRRAFDLPLGPEIDFSDVPHGHAHRDGIRAVAGAGITRGCSDGSAYCPDVAVARAQMASFLARAAERG